MSDDKTLNNKSFKDTLANVPDVELHGNGDLFELISKCSSKKEGWMKSTKAMQVSKGVVIQVSTQNKGNIAESLVFVPDAVIMTGDDGNRYIH